MEIFLSFFSPLLTIQGLNSLVKGGRATREALYDPVGGESWSTGAGEWRDKDVRGEIWAMS
jgi:hypothetical protein